MCVKTSNVLVTLLVWQVTIQKGRLGIQSVFNGYFHIAIEQVIARQSKLSGMPGLSFCPAPPPLSCLPLSMNNTVPSLYPRSTIPSVLQQLILFPDLLPPFSLFAIGFRSLQLKKRIRKHLQSWNSSRIQKKEHPPHNKMRTKVLFWKLRMIYFHLALFV